jgi:tetratricopeptide (TPR) repeat protein
MRCITPIIVLLSLPMWMGSTTDVLMGQGRLEQGQHKLAEDAFRQALVDRPNSNRAKAGLGKSLAAVGACAEALQYLGDIRGERSWNSESLLYEAICHYRVGDDAAYLAALQEAISLTPRDASLWFQLSLGLLRAGDVAGSELAAEVVMELPDSEMYLLLLDAAIAFEKGDPDADYLIHRLIHRTNRIPALMLQGLLLDTRRWLNLGEPSEANRVVEKVIRMDLRNVAAAAWRAESMRRLGDSEFALGAMNRPAVADAASPLRDAIRIRVLVDLGRLDEAKALLDNHPLPFVTETLASRWYLFRALGDEAETLKAVALWENVTMNKHLSLESLIPASKEAK